MTRFLKITLGILLVLGALLVPLVPVEAQGTQFTIDTATGTPLSSGTTVTTTSTTRTGPRLSVAVVGVASVTLHMSAWGPRGHAIALSTPTVVIGPTAIVDLDDYIPSEALGFEVRPKNGTIVMEHPDNLATTPIPLGWEVASGESKPWALND